MSITPLTPAIGGVVEGIELAGPFDDETVAGLRHGLLAHKVLFFRSQPMTEDEQVRLAGCFGEIDLPLFRTASSGRPEVLVLDQVAPRGEGADSWHADNTYMETPPMASILQAVRLPDVGGDTCFASMEAAYDALSSPMQQFLDGLSAVHSLEIMAERTRHVANASLRDEVAKWPPVVHPAVRIHPETGRRMLNVNANWTSHIVELSRAEGDALLRFLYQHLQAPEFQVRFHWEEGSVAIWDNRAVQHYAVPDYDERRVMQRVTITGDRPFGPDRPGRP
ncbi:MAG TPA: TauD/TfdA family dioxygenase [Acidimicrobiales bacterium]|jgi:taurine dioxygenase|nr:TauD/TfdA family dioxygenase [Acidimicrobiales bacterium]